MIIIKVIFQLQLFHFPKLYEHRLSYLSKTLSQKFHVIFEMKAFSTVMWVKLPQRAIDSMWLCPKSHNMLSLMKHFLEKGPTESLSCLKSSLCKTGRMASKMSNDTLNRSFVIWMDVFMAFLMINLPNLSSIYAVDNVELFSAVSFSLSLLLKRDGTSCGRNSVCEVRRWKMVETLLRLWRWKHLDADIHSAIFRLREWNLFFQVRPKKMQNKLVNWIMLKGKLSITYLQPSRIIKWKWAKLDFPFWLFFRRRYTNFLTQSDSPSLNIQFIGLKSIGKKISFIQLRTNFSSTWENQIFSGALTPPHTQNEEFEI